MMGHDHGAHAIPQPPSESPLMAAHIGTYALAERVHEGAHIAGYALAGASLHREARQVEAAWGLITPGLAIVSSPACWSPVPVV